MRLPIRARLTVWYIAVLTAIIAGLGAFVVLQFRADMRATIDRDVRHTWRPLARQYAAGGAAGLRLVQQHGPAARRLRTRCSTPADGCWPPGVTRWQHSLIASPEVRADAIAGHTRVVTVNLGEEGESFRAVVGPIDRLGQRQVLAVAEPFQTRRGLGPTGADAPAPHGARRARRGGRRRLVARSQGPAPGRTDDVEGRADRDRPARRADRGAPRLRRARPSGRDAQRDARPPAARRGGEAAPGRRRLARPPLAARRDARGARREPARRPHAGGARGPRERARGGRAG